MVLHGCWQERHDQTRTNENDTHGCEAARSLVENDREKVHVGRQRGR